MQCKKGFLLTRACIENNIEVECLPGATAFVPALVNSGLPNDKFVFEGFLPVKKGRQTRLLLLAEETRPFDQHQQDCPPCSRVRTHFRRHLPPGLQLRLQCCRGCQLRHSQVVGTHTQC